MLRPAIALLLALPLLAATPAAANASMVCVHHSAGYVARVTVDWQDGGGNWVRHSRGNATAGHRDCFRGDVAVRVTVEGHTGVNWRNTCTETFNLGQSGTLTIKGTSLHQRCERW